MFKYIKWELINEFKSKKYLFGLIALIYILVFALPYQDTIAMNFLYFTFAIIVLGTSTLAFLYGSKRTIDSYKNQTFLLESMIPLSPSKILFAKYILAIIFDILFSIVFVLGLSVVFSKLNINFIKTIVTLIFESDMNTKTLILRMFTFMISSTIAFTSLITLIFIFFKSLFPSGKLLTGFTYGVGMFALFMIDKNILDYLKNNDNGDLIFSSIMLGITFISYLITVWFIEHKLEVYN